MIKIWKRALLFAAFWGLGLGIMAQAPQRWAAADIYEAIQKLNFLGSALYVAAHPDDENTRLIAYLANEVKAETAYLSLTRGDGGQNLIGLEIEELLGLLRTQELLAARRIDGGTQMFSRANDFGFSKHPDETLRIWNKEEVLSDLIWAIRKWQPDVIINRFDHETPGRTHGHHTSSAMLSYEAFDLAGDPAVYPEQLQLVEPWQPRRLFFNTSWWFYGSQEAFQKADKSSMLSLDIGVYYPLKGLSNNEIAAMSRSMHRCQGFGATLDRGGQQEYLKLLKGDLPAEREDLFAGINTTWSRVEGGEKVGAPLRRALDGFDFRQPQAVLPHLLEAYQRLQELPDGHWKRLKLPQLQEAILACLGLYAEITAEDYAAAPGDELAFAIEIINRSPAEVRLEGITYLPMGLDTAMALPLEDNQKYAWSRRLKLPSDLAYTNPYWLNEPWELGMFTVAEQSLRGLPETPRALRARFRLNVQGVPLELEREVVYKRTDPAKGEVYRPFEVTPPVFANLAEKVYVFGKDEAQEVKVRIQAGRAGFEGRASLQLPEGWRAEPAFTEVKLARKGEAQTVVFRLLPPPVQSEGHIQAVVESAGQTYHHELVLIEYDHIPTQTVLRDSRAKVAKVELDKAGNHIGYLMGAGDNIPASLRQIGYEVSLLEEQSLSATSLQGFDAVVVGVRAYNTSERLKFLQPELLEYVKQGGTLLLQYNTTGGLLMPSAEIGPYPFKLSRSRVTVEEAEMRLLQPDHPLLNWPNKITAADFDGWVQERGLYFPGEWDERYEALLSCNDPGEAPLDGGLLVARYGEGYFIYSSLSWFRQLPAGVPGAFRLFANLLSVGKRQG
jgi:LmbE family N-acetylglucosaminyl deacetylase